MSVWVHDNKARGFLPQSFGKRPILRLAGLPTCSSDAGTMATLWQDRLDPLPQQSAGRVEALQVVAVELAFASVGASRAAEHNDS